jgi:hypothetical protein
MNSKDIEKVFNILGPDVTRITYVKGGYKVAIVAPAKEEAKPNPLNKAEKNLYGQGDPGILNESSLVYIKAIINKYRHNPNYELYTAASALCVRQHDLSGSAHTILVKKLTYSEEAWCKSLGILIR